MFAGLPDDNPFFAGKYPQTAHPSGQGHTIEVPGGTLFYAPQFFSRRISDRMFKALLANDCCDIESTDWRQTDISQIKWQTIPWRQDKIQMFGKTHALPRLSSWHGDANRAYTYSGMTLQPNPWNNPLLWLQKQLLNITSIRFNSVLLNWYRDGQDHISWHTDDEPELGKNPTIASVNFGSERRFLLRKCDDHKTQIELPLGHGSVLIMSGPLQHHWQHSVPKQKNVNSSRINLTFRVIHENGDS